MSPLITDFASAVSALIYHGDQVARGSSKGAGRAARGSGSSRLRRSRRWRRGDVVVTAGLTARHARDLPRAAIPSSIPIGTVSARPEATGAGQISPAATFVDPDRLRYVWVILSQDE